MASITITIDDNCNCCAVCGYSGFIDPTQKYMTMTVYDLDKCYFGPARPDGTYTVMASRDANGTCKETVTAASGNFTGIIGTVGPLNSLVNMALFTRVVNQIRAKYHKDEPLCDNPDGGQIYVELSNPL